MLAVMLHPRPTTEAAPVAACRRVKGLMRPFRSPGEIKRPAAAGPGPFGWPCGRTAEVGLQTGESRGEVSWWWGSHRWGPTRWSAEQHVLGSSWNHAPGGLAEASKVCLEIGLHLRVQSPG